MPWTCQYCGKLGDRQGVDVEKLGLHDGQRFCQREGLATLKGQVACCNCLLSCGWKLHEYHNKACLSCIRGAGRKLPPDSARRRAEQQIQQHLLSLPKTNTTQKTTAWLDASARRQKPEIEVVKVFDFDDCLFQTPEQPDWWPSNSYKEMMESLLPPLVPEVCDEGWWNPCMIAAANAAFDDPKTHSVLVTFRGDAFKGRILALLRQQGVQFNEVRFRPLSPFLCDLERSSPARLAAWAQLRRKFPRASGLSFSPQEKHTAVHIGDLAEMCQKATEFHFFIGEHRYAFLAHTYGSSSSALLTHLHSSSYCPHPAGVPSQAELDAMDARKEAVRHAKLNAEHAKLSEQQDKLKPQLVRAAGPIQHLEVASRPDPPLKKSQQLRQPADQPWRTPAPSRDSGPGTLFPPATKTKGPLRRRTFALSSLCSPAPAVSKRRGPKTSGAGGRAVEAEATTTRHFANRGGSKPPRGRTVARVSRAGLLAAWEEDDDDEDPWATSEVEEEEGEGEEEEEEEEEEGVIVAEVPSVAEEGTELDNTADDDGEGRASLSTGLEWEVLSGVDAQSVSSDWYERDLDVLSVASESVGSAAWSEVDGAWSAVGDDDDRDGGVGSDVDLALAVTMAAHGALVAGCDRDEAWACPACTFCNAPSTFPSGRPLPQPSAPNQPTSPQTVNEQRSSGAYAAVPSLAGTEDSQACGTDAALRQSLSVSNADVEPDGTADVVEADAGLACGECGADNTTGKTRCSRCIALRPEEWRVVVGRKQRSGHGSKLHTHIHKPGSGQEEGNVCDGALCLAPCHHCAVLDRGGDVWGGEGCHRRGLKAKVRSKCRWPQQG